MFERESVKIFMISLTFFEILKKGGKSMKIRASCVLYKARDDREWQRVRDEKIIPFCQHKKARKVAGQDGEAYIALLFYPKDQAKFNEYSNKIFECAGLFRDTNNIPISLCTVVFGDDREMALLVREQVYCAVENNEFDESKANRGVSYYERHKEGGNDIDGFETYGQWKAAQKRRQNQKDDAKTDRAASKFAAMLERKEAAKDGVTPIVVIHNESPEARSEPTIEVVGSKSKKEKKESEPVEPVFIGIGGQLMFFEIPPEEQQRRCKVKVRRR